LGVNALDEEKTETLGIWEAMPENNRFWFLVYAVLPFENSDELGDDWFDKPHIYTTEFRIMRDPFCGFIEALERNNKLGGSSIIDRAIARLDGKPVHSDFEKRVQKFPGRGD
jgi:hypothetical protein